MRCGGASKRARGRSLPGRCANELDQRDGSVIIANRGHRFPPPLVVVWPTGGGCTLNECRRLRWLLGFPARAAECSGCLRR